MSSSTSWTRSEDKLFKQLLVKYQETEPYRWEKIASCTMEYKSAEEVKEHYEALLHDVSMIDAGLIELPNYVDDVEEMSMEVAGEGSWDFESNRRMYGISESKRKKGTPWTEEEHRIHKTLQVFHTMTDPLTEAIADGRVYMRPFRRFAHTNFLVVDFEAIHASITNTLRTSFHPLHMVVNRYQGTRAEATAHQIDADCSAYTDILLGQFYNKLRTVLERTTPRECIARMNTRCPLSPTIEFPRWISSTLSSIGRIRIIDGPVDKQICYIPPANTHNNFGRAAMPDLDLAAHTRLNYALSAANIDLAPFDFQNEQGSFCSTIEMTSSAGLLSFHGSCHPSHYENEDIVRAYFLSNMQGVLPFNPISFRIGYVDDKATLDALAALAGPEGTIEGTTADSPGLPVGAHFNINRLGIQLAVAQSAAGPAQARGCYIVGRGTQCYYACTLARELAPEELNRMVDFRVTRTRCAQAQA